MNIEMHGKRIKEVRWPDNGAKIGERLVSGISADDIYMSATRHGDREEFWIVVVRNGKEVSRENPRYVKTIFWDKE